MELSILLSALLFVVWTVPAAKWLASAPSHDPPLVERRTSPPFAPVGSRLDKRLVLSLVRLVGARLALGLLLVVGLLALLGVGWILGIMVQELLGRGRSPLLDGPVQQFLATHRESQLTAVMRLVTYLGDSSRLLGLALLIGLIAWWRIRNPGPLILLTGAYVGARVIETTVKAVTHRPRPPADQALDTFTRLAFPSAHVIYATVMYGALALLLVMSTSRHGRRALISAAAMVLVVLVGLSRMYLGAHWLTDVLGGMILGAGWLWCLMGVPGTVRAAALELDSALLHKDQPTGFARSLRPSEHGEEGS